MKNKYIYWKLKQFHSLLADPGRTRGCSTNTVVIKWLNQWVSDHISARVLCRRQAQMDREGASSHTTNYITQVMDILNLKENVTAILLNVWILPIGGVFFFFLQVSDMKLTCWGIHCLSPTGIFLLHQRWHLTLPVLFLYILLNYRGSVYSKRNAVYKIEKIQTSKRCVNFFNVV